MNAAGIGLIATATLDEDGELEVSLTSPTRTGRLSPREQAASDLLDELGGGTPEMAATLVERLAELVPVHCEDCGVATDVPAFVKALRKGAELS